VRVVGKFIANLTREHWSAIKRVLIYVKGTSSVALCFEWSKLVVKCYVDLDFASDLDKRRSTIGYVFTLIEGTIS